MATHPILSASVHVLVYVVSIASCYAYAFVSTRLKPAPLPLMAHFFGRYYQARSSLAPYRTVIDQSWLQRLQNCIHSRGTIE